MNMTGFVSKIIPNTSIDLKSFLIGAVIMMVVIGLLFLITRRKKPKYDLHNLKKLVFNAGIKTKEVYKSLLELERIFKEMETGGNK